MNPFSVLLFRPCNLKVDHDRIAEMQEFMVIDPGTQKQDIFKCTCRYCKDWV